MAMRRRPIRPRIESGSDVVMNDVAGAGDGPRQNENGTE